MTLIILLYFIKQELFEAKSIVFHYVKIN